MGAAASVSKSNTSTAAAGATKPQATMTDPALREALRQLQLSPDTIDHAAAAVYAHARDPVQHPVDKGLARLCTSEYTRGALHALCWYLAAALNAANGEMSTIAPSVAARLPAACTSSAAVAGEAGSGGVGGEGGGGNPHVAGEDGIGGASAAPSTAFEGGTMTDSMVGRLATIWNSLRRTRSMPSRDRAANAATRNSEENRRQRGAIAAAAAVVGSPRARGVVAGMDDSTPARLSVRVNTTPRGLKKPNLLAGLGLGSPRSASRRAPVRTGRWKLGHEIGKGSFGAVHIGLNEDSGDLIAVKVLSLQNADAAESLYREIDLMRNFTHPNIVCYLGAEVNDSEKTISIFQEWVPGSVTTLLVNFGPFSDRRIAGYTKQILQGLLYLHKERVIHRDIKGGNILIDDRGVVKLCDFGASKMLDTESFTDLGDHTRVGSPLFMAPEILLREDYGPQVDIWSLGGAVLEMATGQPPWHTLNLRTPVALINWVKRTEGPPPLPDSLSKPLSNFLLRCFERDPSKRASAKQLLSDPFVAKLHGEPLKSSASDADSVSDIDNLSRSAAIARIRRASCSDCSRPGSAVSSCASVPFRSSSRSPRGACGRADAISEVDGSPGRRSPDSSGARRLSAQAEGVPPLNVVTAGLEPSSTTPRTITTPPSRRFSAGRGGSVSPNPFGGRRRSLEHSPDASRSPRGGSISPRTSYVSRPRGVQESQHKSGAAEGGNGGGAAGRRESEGGGGDEGEGAAGSAMAEENVKTVDMSSVNTKRGSNAAPALKRSESKSSVSTSRVGREGEDAAKGEPASEGSPARTAAEGASSKPRKSGRGGRPGGAAGDDWRWNQ